VATNPKRLFDDQLDLIGWFGESSDVRAWFSPELATTTAGGGSTAYILTALAGTYSLSGGAASLKVNRKVTANAGTYGVTGGSAVLKVNRKLTANAGSYSVTGGSATLTKSVGAIAYTLTGLAGSYALTGGNASLVYGRSMTASAGVYSLTGGSATLTKMQGPQALTLTGLAGSYALFGGDAVLTWSGEKSGGGGYDDDKTKRKKRYVVEQDGKLLVFSSRQAAYRALDQAGSVSEAPNRQDAKKAHEAVKVQAPEVTIALDQIRALAAERHALEVFQQQLARMQYESLLRHYETWRDEQDIEDILGMI
jgi:hypothetical protein